MKKILMILGGFFLSILILVSAFFAYFAITGSELDKESKAFVMETVPVICSGFDLATFHQYESPELRQAVSQEEMSKVFNWFKSLGQFKKVVEAPGDANISVTTQNGKVITAKYNAKVEFETGPATIEIVLVKRDGAWKYRVFKINSMALMQKVMVNPASS